MTGETHSAEMVWLLGSLIGLVWWPGQLYTLAKRKTSVEHNIVAWIVATVGQTCSVIAGHLFDNRMLFWTMVGYLVLHLSLLSVIVWFRVNPGVSHVCKSSQ